MQQSEQPRNEVPQWFIQAVGRLFALYPGAASGLTPLTIPAWWEHLKRFDQKKLARAFAIAPEAAGGKWIPSAQLIAELSTDKLPGQALAEWERLRSEMIRTGNRPDLKQLSDVTKRCVELAGGIHSIAMTSQDEMAFVRKRFEQDFNSMTERGDRKLQIFAYDNAVPMLGDGKNE